MQTASEKGKLGVENGTEVRNPERDICPSNSTLLFSQDIC